MPGLSEVAFLAATVGQRRAFLDLHQFWLQAGLEFQRSWFVVVTVMPFSVILLSLYNPTLQWPWMILPALSVIILAIAMPLYNKIDVDKHGPGWCQGCSYNLRGLESSHCPECGKEFETKGEHEEER